MILLALLVFLFCAAAQQNPTPSQAGAPATSAIPADAARQVNPVRPTAESLAQGKKYYGYDCAMCHGTNGDGKGEVAVDERLKMSDFTDPATLKGRTDGELFYIIKNGHGQMPPEGDRVKPTELWNMVNYVRSFSSKKGQ